MIVLPLMLGRVREVFMATGSLFIFFFLAPSRRVPINIQGLGARERDRGQVICRKATGREGGRERECKDIAERGDLFVLLSVATHRETNAFGKLQDDPPWLWSTLIDFLMIFISVQYWLAEVIVVYDDICIWLENRAMKSWTLLGSFMFDFFFETWLKLNVMLYAKYLEAYIWCLSDALVIWQVVSTEGRRAGFLFLLDWLRRQYGNVLTCHTATRGKLEATLHVQTCSNPAVGNSVAIETCLCHADKLARMWCEKKKQGIRPQICSELYSGV